MWCVLWMRSNILHRNISSSSAGFSGTSGHAITVGKAAVLSMQWICLVPCWTGRSGTTSLCTVCSPRFSDSNGTKLPFVVQNSLTRIPKSLCPTSQAAWQTGKSSRQGIVYCSFLAGWVFLPALTCAATFTSLWDTHWGVDRRPALGQPQASDMLHWMGLPGFRSGWNGG